MYKEFRKLKNRSVKTLRDEIYISLKKSIIRGDLKRGKRVFIDQIAREINVSRTPVREAILKLEQEGLMKSMPKNGFIVSRFSEKDIKEIFGIRSVLEGYAGWLAVAKMNQRHIASLEKIILQSESCLRQGNMGELSKINDKFHDKINKWSGSDRLYRMIQELRDYIMIYRIAILKTAGKAEISIADHRMILAAIKAGESERTRELIQAHISKGLGIILKELERETGLEVSNRD
jgi:DNA-binding GntR family transcriptional regulator